MIKERKLIGVYYMGKIEVLKANFGERSYKLLYGRRLLERLSQHVPKSFGGSRFLVISNRAVKNLFGKRIEAALQNKCLEWLTIPDGEKHKNLDTVYRIYKSLATHNMDKESYVVALGGGVLQDLVTYSCATYRRGIPLIQIPTTVLAQADIGIGGCAVNHEMGKSLIGTVYQPVLVVNDIDTLDTLPKKQLINGRAEIICKVVCLGGEKIKKIKKDVVTFSQDKDLLINYIKLSAKHKKEIVEKDETGSKGTRIILDYGHTVTYALETLTGYRILHGFGLGIGMHIAAVLSCMKGHLSKENVVFLKSLIEISGLPTQLPQNIHVGKLIDQMKFDQKTVNGKIRFVLLKNFGEPFLSGPMGRDEISDAIQKSREY